MRERALSRVGCLYEPVRITKYVSSANILGNFGQTRKSTLQPDALSSPPYRTLLVVLLLLILIVIKPPRGVLTEENHVLVIFMKGERKTGRWVGTDLLLEGSPLSHASLVAVS